MHGIGNDFVMVDLFQNDLSPDGLPQLAKAVCDRRFGIGADGLITASEGQDAPFQMRMFNPDGSESEMCGNGVRCFAKFVRDHNHTTETTIPVETGAGLLHLEIQDDGQIRVNMGKARLKAKEIGMVGDPEGEFINQPLPHTGFHGTAVSMGNPHLVIFVDDLDPIDLYETGRPLEKHPLFTNRTNVHFVKVLHPEHIQIKIWERGAGATLACGTGACACAVASYLNGHTKRNIKVTLPGGNLQIEYLPDQTVFMTGPAETSFEGTWLD